MVWVSPDGLGKAWLRISWKNLSWCSGKHADSTVRQTRFRDCLEFGSSFLTFVSLSFRNCNINLTALSGKVKFYEVFDSVSDNMLVIKLLLLWICLLLSSSSFLCPGMKLDFFTLQQKITVRNQGCEEQVVAVEIQSFP